MRTPQEAEELLRQCHRLVEENLRLQMELAETEAELDEAEAKLASNICRSAERRMIFDRQFKPAQ